MVLDHRRRVGVALVLLAGACQVNGGAPQANAPQPRSPAAPPAVATRTATPLAAATATPVATSPVATATPSPQAGQGWLPITAAGAPAARAGHTAVWTGAEMLVWGGNSDPSSLGGDKTALADGARYSPATDSWAPGGERRRPWRPRWPPGCVDGHRDARLLITSGGGAVGARAGRAARSACSRRRFSTGVVRSATLPASTR